MGFSIDKQAALAATEENGSPFNLRTADGKTAYKRDGEPCTITMAGTHSPRYIAKSKELDRQKIRGGMTMEAVRDRTMELVVHCTLRWDIEDDDGQQVPFHRANVEMMYTKCPWVYADAQEKMEAHADFFESASPPPPPT